MNVLDLFCGAGGFSLGFQQAGFKIVAGIDNDTSALSTYAHNFTDSSAVCLDLFSDYVETLNEIGNIDIILGGPPCQGFSIAGKRDKEDPRNTLFNVYLDIVRRKQPSIVVMENVPNILSMDKGRFAKKIISGLEILGFNISVVKLNCAEYGVPQSRKRVFFIGVKHGSVVPEDFQPYKTANEITTQEAIDDLPLLDDNLGAESCEYGKEPVTEYQLQMRKNSNVLLNHSAVKHTDKTKSIIALVPDGMNYKSLPIELQGTRKVNIAWTRMNSTKPCFTIDAGHNHHFHYKANRVPTVRECARIQSFPDTFQFLGNRTSQYRQVGNAVPPLISEVIANIIKQRIHDNGIQSQ